MLRRELLQGALGLLSISALTKPKPIEPKDVTAPVPLPPAPFPDPKFESDFEWPPGEVDKWLPYNRLILRPRENEWFLNNERLPQKSFKVRLVKMRFRTTNLYVNGIKDSPRNYFDNMEVQMASLPYRWKPDAGIMSGIELMTYHNKYGYMLLPLMTRATVGEFGTLCHGVKCGRDVGKRILLSSKTIELPHRNLQFSIPVWEYC